MLCFAYVLLLHFYLFVIKIYSYLHFFFKCNFLNWIKEIFLLPSSIWTDICLSLLRNWKEQMKTKEMEITKNDPLLRERLDWASLSLWTCGYCIQVTKKLWSQYYGNHSNWIHTYWFCLKTMKREMFLSMFINNKPVSNDVLDTNTLILQSWWKCKEYGNQILLITFLSGRLFKVIFQQHIQSSFIFLKLKEQI